ncbi:uncharacterized protein LOC122756554 [Drosophila santomea]|uniref:uncharacterized protein LOC122756554 n=1 Tax=Drosophila santomea TaxID=129105 RepID=UPI001CC9788C|nr:uncharacterized protein LOC122756554 [Drosophila santomea]
MKNDQPVKQRYYPKNPKKQGGEVHKQPGFEGRVLADSVGSGKSAIYGIYSAGKGPNSVESNATSATFQRSLDQVIGPEMMPHAFAYQDDIIVIGRTLQEHNRNMKEVFRRLWAASLKVNADKCKFFRKELQFLGYRVTDQGIGTDPEKKQANRHQEAFEAVKTRLVADPILACPDFRRTFVLQTDASDYGLGAILTPHSEQGERVISYSSRALNGAEKNYSATEKECLAIVWAVRKLRPYLEGYHFKVITDHMALKWLNSIESPSGRIARWALELQQFDFEISYRKGQLNIVADALSRQPLQETSRRITATECRWIEEMRRKIKQDPQKYPDYQLYRHIPHRAGNEDVVSWKLCVCTNQGEAARHGREPRHADGRTPGKSEDSCAGGSQVPLARNAPRHKKVRAELRELHEVQAQPAASSRKNSDPGPGRTGTELQLAVNPSVAETTGYPPAFIKQGREPRLPNALFDEQTAGTGRCKQTPAENA